jgi:hypothetical protein
MSFFNPMDREAGQTPSLSIQEYYSQKERGDRVRKSTYDKILGMIFARIRRSMTGCSAVQHIWYQIPTYVFGCPRFSMEDCITYIVYQLQSNQLDVVFYAPFTLYITWERHEKQYNMTRNPFAPLYMAASTPPPPTAPAAPTMGEANTRNIALAGAVAGAVAGTGTVAGAGPVASAMKKTRQPTRRVEDYRPPSNVVYDNKTMRDMEERSRVVTFK